MTTTETTYTHGLVFHQGASLYSEPLDELVADNGISADDASALRLGTSLDCRIPDGREFRIVPTVGDPSLDD